MKTLCVVNEQSRETALRRRLPHSRTDPLVVWTRRRYDRFRRFVAIRGFDRSDIVACIEQFLQAFDDDGHRGVEELRTGDGQFLFKTVFYSEKDSLPVTLNYEFPGDTSVCGYGILSVPWLDEASTDSPTDWTFEGSSDGNDYEVLDRKENQPAWGPLEWRRFELSPTARFKHFRLRITQVRGRDDGYGNLKKFVGLSEVEMFGLTDSTDMSQDPSTVSNHEESEPGEGRTSDGWPDDDTSWGSSTADAQETSKTKDDTSAPSSKALSRGGELYEDVRKDTSVLDDDLGRAEEDVVEFVDYDDGHAAEVILMLGLAMFVVGFVLIRFKQSRPRSSRLNTGSVAYSEVERPPDGTYDLPLTRDRAHHGEL